MHLTAARYNLLEVARLKSPFTDEPVVAIITGLRKTSKNPKTGNMLQLWLLPEEVSPDQAVIEGSDDSVCGDCPLRGDSTRGTSRLCYVTVQYGPLAIWKAWRNGQYEKASPQALRWLAGRSLRFGAYGNPSVLPYELGCTLADALGDQTHHTAYEHAWRQDWAQDWRGLAMASVETPEDAALAWKKGWRTFRVRAEEDPLLPGERECPAQSWMPNPTTCEKCGWCDGQRRQRTFHVSVQLHGGTAITPTGLRRVQQIVHSERNRISLL